METLKACALIGLHLSPAEDEAGSSGSQSPDLGDIWRYGYQEALTGTGTLGHGLKAKALLHRSSANTTWKNLALSVMGEDQSGEKISLFLEE